MEIVKKALINAGNFKVSIGTYDTRDVAIFSKHSGEFVKLKQAKVSKKLRKIKRQFKGTLNSDTTFTFSFMQPEAVKELIQILKKG